MHKLMLNNGVLIYHSNQFFLNNHDIKIKVNFCGICGSDLKIINNKIKNDIVLGHEISGIVVDCKIPEKYSNLINQRVTVYPIIPCHSCNFCKIGLHRDCVNKVSIGFDIDGGFSSFISVPAWNVYKIETDISDREICLIETTACAVRLLKEFFSINLSKDSEILIIGDGVMAILAARLLNYYNFTKVTILGKHQYRLSLAPLNFIRTNNIETINTKFDLILNSMEDRNIHQLLHKYLKKNSYIFPQSRIHDAILKKLSFLNVKIGRAFAYLKEDFNDAEFLIANTNLSLDIISNNIIDLQNVPELIHNGLSKKTGLKFLVNCQ